MDAVRKKKIDFHQNYFLNKHVLTDKVFDSIADIYFVTHPSLFFIINVQYGNVGSKYTNKKKFEVYNTTLKPHCEDSLLTLSTR